MKFLLFLIASTAPIIAFAATPNGAISGGGGKSVVCRDTSGEIVSAQMLDLYEGQVLYGLHITPSSGDMKSQIATALSRLSGDINWMVRFYSDSVQAGLRLTPSGTVLTTIDDSYEIVLPKGCAAEQVANYYNDNLILVNSDIWAKLDDTNRAALILHEAVYAQDRQAGAKDSRHSRHVVASLFDASTHWTDPKAGVPANALNCFGSGVYAWAYQDPGNHQWVLQFQLLGQAFIVSQKILPTYGNLDFSEAANPPIKKGEDQIGITETFTAMVQSDFEDQDLVTIQKRWESPMDGKGAPVPGLEVLHYYLSWTSRSYPALSTPPALLNCSLQIPPQG